MNAAVAAASALAGLLTGVVAVLAFRWSEREQARPTRTAMRPDNMTAVLPPGVDTVLSVLRSSAVVLDEGDTVVKASSAAYALGLVRGGRLAVDQMLQMARETRRDGEIRQVELDLPRRGAGRGEGLAVSARVAPLGSRLVLLLVEDLTEARRIEAVRRDFVANVSHELKTPVGALSLLSEAVMDAADDPEAVNRFAGRMQIEATRLTSLVQEIIDLSRVQNDDLLDDAEPVAVEDLVAEAVDRCRHQANTKQITMATGTTPDLFIWGNRGQLAAALGNLVENAVNYSPARTRVGIAGRRIPASGGTSRAAGSGEETSSRSPSPTRASASPRRTATGSSSASTGWTRRARGPPAAPGSVCPSSSTWPPRTAGRSRCGAPKARAPPSHCGFPRQGSPATARFRQAPIPRPKRTPTRPTSRRTTSFSRLSPNTSPPRRSSRDPRTRRRGRRVLQ